MKRSELEVDVLRWAKDRNLLVKDNAKNQALKTVSEVGELCDAILKNKENDILDAIGDVEVCLTILKEQLEYEQDVPLALAYKVIKDRTGETVNGTFIKDE